MTEQTAGTAVVTGASSGIGLEYAEQLAKRGFDLFLVARRTDRLSELATRLQSRYGSRVTTVVADLSKAGEVQRVVDVVRADPAITMVVNNAGIMLMGPPRMRRPIRLTPFCELTSMRLCISPWPRSFVSKQKVGGHLSTSDRCLALQAIPAQAPTAQQRHSFSLSLAAFRPSMRTAR